MIVMKFGGTSVGSGERMLDVATIVAAYRAKQPIIVVSAMSQVTNLLVDLAAAAVNKQPARLAKDISRLSAMHAEAIAALGLSTTEEDALSAIVSGHITKLAEILDSILSLGELTPRGSDLIVSFGERLSVHLVAAALRQKGLDAAALEADELLVTDDNFGNAQPLLVASRKRAGSKLQRLLKQGITPVITGFIGATRGGITTTLGRGGSDYSATIIGYCAGANEVWIWTDVDGVMSADPRVIKGAHTIHELSYDEAAELSYFGAKVLHPRTMVPAAMSGTPIYIKNTMNPDGEGTKITGSARPHPDGAKAITVLANLSLITIQGKGMQGVYGVAAKVFTALAEQQINVLFISQASSENNISLVINAQDDAKAVRALRVALRSELKLNSLEAVDKTSGLAMIAVVGEGMRSHTGIAGRVFSALGRAKINVIAIAQGSSERNISFIVTEQSATAAVQSIHDELHLNNGHQAGQA